MAKKFVDLIEKYNPYHDAKGRFTTGGKASFFSIPKNKELAARLKEKEKYRSGNTSESSSGETENNHIGISSENKIDREKCRRIKNNDEGVVYAKERSKKFDEKTEDAIVTYTGSQYEEINGMMRGTKTTEQVIDKYIKNGYTKEYAQEKINDFKNTSKRLKNAIEKNKIDEDIIVYRGAGADAFGISATKEYKNLIGKTLSDKAFMSTSISQEMANMFTHKVSENGKSIKGALIEIAVPKGTNGIFPDGLSATEKECEFILGPNSKIKITDIKIPRTNKPVTIVAEYVGGE